MTYVTLPSNSSMNIFPDNKISHFKVNLPEVLKVDPEHWEVALKEIQFPHLWYNVREDKNYFTGWYNTTVGQHKKKRVEIKFMKVVKPGYYSSVSELVAELNAKIPTTDKTMDVQDDQFNLSFDYDHFSNKCTLTMSDGVSVKMEGSDLALRLGFKENEIIRSTHDSLLCGAYVVFFGIRLARSLDLQSILDYFTWNCRLNDEFMYRYIKEKL